MADEIVRDAYAGLIERGEDVEQPVAYLQRSVINLAINAVRRRRRFEGLPQRAGRESEIPQLDETWVVIGTLSQRQRAVVVLRNYEDRSYEQIADSSRFPLER